MSIRSCSVAGSFYPASSDEIERYVEHFSQDLNEIDIPMNIKALIVPHAGYIYSGFTANLAYHLAQKKSFKRVIVIGPSHRVFLEGSSIAMYDEYETPLGNIEIDMQYCKELKEEFEFLFFNQNAHSEHSTETQMPFIKNYFEDAKVVEIVYGKQDHKSLAALVDYCMKDEDNLVVISTDLSHFYTLQEAQAMDNICLEAIANKDMNGFEQGCEACGIIGVKALIQTAIKEEYKVEFLNYCTSYDRTQDESSVVGYCSFLIGE